MSDDLAAVGSDSLPTASVSSSGNAPRDVSNQLPQSIVDAWNVTFNVPKLAKPGQDAGWQPVSPNRPAEAAPPSNEQRSGLNFALAPSNVQPSTGPQWLPLGGTYDPKTDTWEHTQGAASNTIPNAPTSPATHSTAPGSSFAERFGATTPAPTAGGTSPATGAIAQASHSSARRAGATPSPIAPARLPPGPLNQADYARVGEHNRYLASKYDPSNVYDRFIDSFTGAMNDPANVRTPSEQAEHEALSQAISGCRRTVPRSHGRRGTAELPPFPHAL
jgi:hypothetical protein